MLKQMYRQWWKILGALLVLISLVAGLALPIGPGIVSISVDQLQTGSTATTNITGYNTHFATGQSSLQVLLRHDTLYLCGQVREIAGEDHLVADFVIPDNLPTNHTDKVYDLVINNDVDGTFALRKVVTILGTGTTEGAQAGCRPEVSVNEPAYLSLPYRIILYETIRNLFFHVPMWFVMTFLLLLSFVQAIRYLSSMQTKHDILSAELVNVAIFFGVLGFATGSLWGHYTWGNLGDWLLKDTKVLGALIALLIYLAYFVLRGSLRDEAKKARISAVYNIFSFVLFIVFIYVLPRMTESLHPGNGGNPAFNIYDVDDTMRPVFYTAVIGWILMGLWLASIRTRIRFIHNTIGL